jgi:hypothetical protein
VRLLLIAWAFLAAAILAALSGLPEKPHANLLGGPFSTGGPSLTSIARVGTAPTALGPQGPGTITSYTASYTVTSNTNTAVIVLESRLTGGGATALSTVAYAPSTSCVNIGVAAGQVTSGFQGSVWFCPVNGTTGAHNFTFTYAGPIQRTMACVIEYTGVAQTTATEGFGSTATSNANPQTVNVTTAVANDWIIGFQVGMDNTRTTSGTFQVLGTATAGAGQCLLPTIAGGTAIDSNQAVPATTTAATVTDSSSGSSDEYMMAFGLKHG